MKRGLLIATMLLTTPAYALSTENLSCEMPGVGEAAFITGFDGRYQLFDWWDKTGDTLGTEAVVLADCQGGQILRVTTPESTDRLVNATDALWTAGQAGQLGDVAALTAKLRSIGFTVEAGPLAQDHCACSDEMMRLSGQ
jgi:hypothetical protein